MEKNTKNIAENTYDDDYVEQAGSEGEEDINFDELTSHKIDKNVLSQKRRKRLIIILEHAYVLNKYKFINSNLEITKSKKDIEIINSDDHSKLIRQMKKSLEEFRPDVSHQVNCYFNPKIIVSSFSV